MDSRKAARARALVLALLAGASASIASSSSSGALTAGSQALAAGNQPETVAVPHGGGYSRGRSTILVSAPIDKVRGTVLDFPSYPQFMPHYSKCKVLGRTPTGARDVFMEVSALHGAVTLWARVEVPKPSTVDGVETYETRFVEGNVHELKAIWRLKRVSEGSTELSLEIFLHPKLPLPKKMINQENLDGSAAAVVAAKKRAEGRS